MHVDLSTADQEGRRKWIYPQLVPRFWWKARLALAIALMAWLFLAPWLRVNHKQALFFDLVKRKIDFLGYTIFINETLIILAFIFSAGAAVLLFTALLGRVFCGWACPFTVFMEFVFRPIERLFEGHGHQQRLFQSRPLSDRWVSVALKWSLFTVIAFVLANTFVAYFLGSDRLLNMIADGPFAHPTPFFSMLFVSSLVLFQFGCFGSKSVFLSVPMDDSNRSFSIKTPSLSPTTKNVERSGESPASVSRIQTWGTVLIVIFVSKFVRRELIFAMVSKWNAFTAPNVWMPAIL